ncbi:MAG TPA: hypothetical protein VN867_08950, partial [Candidatus Binataceae bacterium]|nr:hypothetical protein [Candidatus Binataceae bacterium]
MLLSGSYAPSSAHSSLHAISPGTGGGVTAYIPDGDYQNGITGIEVVPVTGSGPARTSIATTNPVNSCSANQTSGEVVCTDNLNGIYLINGATLSSTLMSGGTNQEEFSGGLCTTCGVVVDTAHNRAILSIADNASPSPTPSASPSASPSPSAGAGAYQVLDLSGNTLSAPISPPAMDQIAESFGFDTGANLILSADEPGFFDLIDISNLASPIAYEFAGGNQDLEFDSSAIDSTGIVISGGEFGGDLFIADLSQATFSPQATPPTWNAPNQIQYLPEFDSAFGYFSSGLTGLAIASGTNETFLEDEFGFANSGAGMGVIKLPASAGSGTPAATDWVVAHMPTTPNGAQWDMPLDPHGLTAARANIAITNGAVGLGGTPKGIGFVINDERTYLAIVDMDALLGAPRAAADANQLDPNYTPLQSNLIAYVPINASSLVNYLQNSDFNDGLGYYTTATVSAGSSSGFPNFNVSTNAGMCDPAQTGNPFLSVNVPNGADGYFQQQVSLPGSPTSLSFTTWGSVDPVTVTVSVVPATGP